MKNIIFIISYLVGITTLTAQDWVEITPTFHLSGNFDVFYAGHFINSDTGWCSDRNGGRIWKTTNGGYDWYLQRDSVGDGRIRDFYFYDEFEGLAFGDGIWKTKDAGENWTKTSNNIVVSYNNYNKNTVYISGKEGVQKTTDRGENWQIILQDSTAIYSFFLNDSLGWVSLLNFSAFGRPSYLLRTTTGGKLWDTLLYLYDFNHLTNFYFFDEYIGVFSGYNTIKTEDGGESIKVGNYPTRKMVVVSKNLIFFTGYDQGIYYSTDMGITLLITPDSYGRIFYGLEYLEKNNKIFGFSIDKKISVLDLVTSAVKVDHILFDEFDLQAYPNPFNSHLTIVLINTNSKNANANIYDIEGRLIKSLNNWINENKVVWEGKNNKGINVPNGIYFLVVNSNEKIKTKKIVYLK